MSNALVFLLSFVLPRRVWYRRFYLRSAHWRTLRERVGSARSWECQVYGCVERGRHLDLHHVTNRLWRERGADVRLLCRRHHAKVFCTENYKVTFPMTSKDSIKGDAKHPLSALLTQNGGDVGWNFEKFLIGKDGKVLKRFGSDVEPMYSPELL